MTNNFGQLLDDELEAIKKAGLWKTEYEISSPQGREITISGRKILNFCANNYLGLAGSKTMEEASGKSVHEWGYGLASVRFICGTQTLHKTLEKAAAEFVGTEDAVLYSSCFMANMGLFQTFFGPEDAIISDSLNHASIIDGIRLSKAERLVYAHMDLDDLRQKLQTVKGNRLRLIATDGVFSMDGHIAPIDELVAIASEYNALLMVDDAHATGVVGASGRGTSELKNVMGRVDFITSTFGKALGGAGGAFIATSAKAASILRQRSRTYLFSNSLDTGVAGASLEAISYLKEHPEVRDRLWQNTNQLKSGLAEAGFKVASTEHPITPIMLGDEKIAQEMARALFDKGIYAIAFSYPVVPKGTARIRLQVSAAHLEEDIQKAVEAFASLGKKFGSA